jgi:uncharacterized protein with HEPN domain
MWPDDGLLLDMLVAAREARMFVQGVTWERFMQDRLLQRGLINALQDIGEAANNVSTATTLAHPEIPWSDIIGMRHRLVHGYRQINLRIVWETVQQRVPELIAALEPLIPPEEDL